MCVCRRQGALAQLGICVAELDVKFFWKSCDAAAITHFFQQKAGGPGSTRDLCSRSVRTHMCVAESRQPWLSSGFV